jgi:DNA-binding NarL/FixJ family response regulator
MIAISDRRSNTVEGNAVQASIQPAGTTEASLHEALKSALDSIAVGVVLVDRDSHVLHANQAAREMLDGRSPIVSLAGRLGALHESLTEELRDAIAAAIHIGGGIGLPLINRDMTAATAHIAPVTKPAGSVMSAAAIFVSSANRPSQIDLSAVARIFKLSPAESRLLRYLVGGMPLADAAVALGLPEATANSHQSQICSKVGVSHWTQLMIQITRLLPPICR